MNKWAEGARYEDTSTLKRTIVSFIALDPAVTPVVPPLPENRKELRGFNHPMIARLLCSRSDIAIFDAAGSEGPQQ